MSTTLLAVVAPALTLMPEGRPAVFTVSASPAPGLPRVAVAPASVALSASVMTASPAIATAAPFSWKVVA